MIYYLGLFLKAFFLTFILAVPYIGFLYRFNIRRIQKVDLEKVLPGRVVKMGTPIMGGGLIIFSVIVLLSIALYKWTYFPVIVVVLLLGSIVGFIDEYINTLGRTFKTIRKSKGGRSLFELSGPMLLIKRAFLVPWRWFEEALRVMGGEQKGMGNHYKLLTQVLVVVSALALLAIFGFDTVIWIPFLGSFAMPAILYYLFVGFLMLGFNVAFGITDGMDGLSAGTHFVSFVAFGIFAAYTNNLEVATVSFVVAGAELAFLYFNLYPARFEMSDVGTVPIGMLFVLIGVFLHRELILPIIGAVYVVEILSSVLQQWSVKLRGKRLFLVAPIHHHFEKMGWHETKVVSRIWVFAVVCGVLGLYLMMF